MLELNEINRFMIIVKYDNYKESCKIVNPTAQLNFCHYVADKISKINRILIK